MADVIGREAEGNSASAGVDDARLQELVEQARAEGLQLTSEGGLLGKLTKAGGGVGARVRDGRSVDHLGYGKHERAGRGGLIARL